MIPNFVFPFILNFFKNGTGSIRTNMSKNMLLALCAAKLMKRTSGSLLPHATHVPGVLKAQFFLIGRQEKRARMVNVKPHNAIKAMRHVVRVRANLRSCPLKRRAYWKRIASLINVVLDAYVTLVAQTY